MRLCLSAALIAVVIAAATTHADVVYFNNGDKLTGKLISVIDGKAVFNSDLAGEITIDTTEVSTFQTDAPVKVQLSDGTTIEDKLVRSEKGTVELPAARSLKNSTLSFDQIAAINPPPPAGPKITGSVSTALSSSHGNTKADSRALSFDIQREFEKSRTIGVLDYAKSRQRSSSSDRKHDTENWWRSRLKHDFLFDEKYYAYAEGRLESDKIALLDRRTILGGGLGYQWIKSDRTNFRTETGLSQRRDTFTDNSDTVNETAVQFGYLFNHKFNGKIKFFHELTYYPAISDPSDYLLTTTAEIRASVIGSMFVNFKVLFDYDAIPADTAGSTDIKYLFGAGLDF